MIPGEMFIKDDEIESGTLQRRDHWRGPRDLAGQRDLVAEVDDIEPLLLSRVRRDQLQQLVARQ